MDHIHSNTIEDVRTPGRHLSLEERGMIQAGAFPSRRCFRRSRVLASKYSFECVP